MTIDSTDYTHPNIFKHSSYLVHLDKRRNEVYQTTYLSVVLFAYIYIYMSEILFFYSLVNVIANSTTRYYTRTRLTTQTTLDLPVHKQMLAPFNSASPADCIEPNFAGERTSSPAHIDTCIQRRIFACSRFGRKGFYRYEFNFRTNNPGLFLSLSLSTCPGNTRRTKRYVPMQTWFAGYLERNKGGELSSTQRHISAGYP